ncbi:uncharacterized protein MELLADRAFT_87109 [Melampsora larici-populina 98AG31]|uniref:Uncharacterized protein n=1 Tax=Melampsora larici-populina (strain 98AG31 / pathotype 3-4-7) TaxID=747676 RepID=F4R4J1_MELLP|nr:uncharacterized protein MELLADRAFT_87109 [Melampsora larici-populina 98AG31]EGG12993.1 hypothetical protein MELLADRAFT_87109 [Melampsora larici-populina 98AG31]
MSQLSDLSKMKKFKHSLTTTHSSFKGLHTKCQIPQANINNFVSNLRRVTPDPTDSDSNNTSTDNNTTGANNSTDDVPTTPTAKHLAKNLTSVTNTTKAAKAPHNISAVTLTLPSKSCQTASTNAKRPTTSPISSITTPEAQAPALNVDPDAGQEASRTMSPTTLYAISGGATICVAVLFFGIWKCCNRKRTCEGKHKLIWGVDEYRTSFYDSKSEKPKLNDTKLLNKINGNQIGDELIQEKSSLSKSIGRTNQNRNSKNRESKLWGSAEDLGDTTYHIPLPYNTSINKQRNETKSLYEDLDFGPAVMLSQSELSSIPSIPENVHHSKDSQLGLDSDYNNSSVNGLVYNGWERAHQVSSDEISNEVLPNHLSIKKTELIKSKSTSDRRHKPRPMKPNFPTSSSMNWLSEIGDRESDHQKEMERLDPMPADSHVLCDFSSDFPSMPSAIPYHPTIQLAIPTPAMLPGSNSISRSLLPHPNGLLPGHYASNSNRPLMSPLEASKELEDMLHCLDKALSPQPSPAESARHLQDRFSNSGSTIYNPVTPFYVIQSIPSSDTPRIIGDASATLTNPPTCGVSYYSEMCDISNYTGQIGQPEGVQPGQFARYSQLYPNLQDLNSIQNQESQTEILNVLPIINPISKFDLPELQSIQTSPESNPFQSQHINHPIEDAYCGISTYDQQPQQPVVVAAKEGLSSHHDGFIPLGQMNFKRQDQPDYRSPTFSVYGMYNK